MTYEPHDSEGVRFTDKRRIDPETGEIREPRQAAAPDLAEPEQMLDDEPAATEVEGGQPVAADIALAERTADLQRLQAEYLNYKRRVDRDREAAREAATASTLTALLPVLDDIGRAREHDELTGGFKAVAESFERIVSGLGLVGFGEVGDPFDPRIHDALMHSYSDEVDEPVCQAILQVGYRLGDRVVRPARVAVAEPESASAGAPADEVPEDGAATGSAAGEAAPPTYDDNEKDSGG